MKKFLSLILAALILFSISASAESAKPDRIIGSNDSVSVDPSGAKKSGSSQEPAKATKRINLSLFEETAIYRMSTFSSMSTGDHEFVPPIVSLAYPSGDEIWISTAFGLAYVSNTDLSVNSVILFTGSADSPEDLGNKIIHMVCAISALEYDPSSEQLLAFTGKTPLLAAIDIFTEIKSAVGRLSISDGDSNELVSSGNYDYYVSVISANDPNVPSRLLAVTAKAR